MKAIHPGLSVALASGRVNDASPGGSRAASGSITYAGNLSAGHTLVINGTPFTCMASGATGNQFNVGGSLSATLDAIVAVLNASAVADVAKATYSKGGSNDALLVAHDAEGSAGNDFTLGVTGSGTVSGPKLTGGLDADKLGDAEMRYLVTVAGAANYWDLPAGDEGQEQTFFFKTKGSGANAVVRGTFAGAATTATFDSVGDYVKLKWMNGAWVAIINNSVTIA